MCPVCKSVNSFHNGRCVKCGLDISEFIVSKKPLALPAAKIPKKKLWKILIISIGCLLLFTLIIRIFHSETNMKNKVRKGSLIEMSNRGMVTGVNCNVRTAPDLSSKVITKLTYKIVEILEEPENGWIKIEVDDQVGYIYAGLIAFKHKDYASAIVDAGPYLNLRQQPAINSKSIAHIKNRSKIFIETSAIEHDGYKWVKAYLPDGKQGYVASKYLILIGK